jgi:hypothetical protein
MFQEYFNIALVQYNLHYNNNKPVTPEPKIKFLLFCLKSFLNS